MFLCYICPPSCNFRVDVQKQTVQREFFFFFCSSTSFPSTVSGLSIWKLIVKLAEFNNEVQDLLSGFVFIVMVTAVSLPCHNTEDVSVIKAFKTFNVVKS